MTFRPRFALTLFATKCRPREQKTREHGLDFQTSRARHMAWAIVLPGTKRKRGNPYWGQPLLQARMLSTEFEMQDKRMLSQSQFFASAELKHWCALSRNRVYIIGRLIDAWRLSVDVPPSGVT